MSIEPEVPDKLYFKIGEVARLVGVKSYVLRYWESEFAGLLRPEKTEARHRLYRRRDVETLRTIKRLLHQERYTIEGARRRLRHGLERAAAPPEATAPAAPPTPPQRAGAAAAAPDRPDEDAVLVRVRAELREICRRLAAEPGEAPPLRIG